MSNVPQALGSSARRTISYMVDPAALVVTGIDVTDTDHLSDERIKLPIDKALVDSIVVDGVIDPVTVHIKAGRAYVVDGRRRTVHAREAKKQRKDLMIPVVVPQDVSDLDAEVLAALGNAFRVQDNHLAEARKAKRLLDKKVPDVDVRRSFGGWSPATLKNRLALLELHPKVQKMIEEGKLSSIAAVQLCDLDEDEQLEAAEDLVKAAGQHGSKGQTKAAKAKKKQARGEEGHIAPTKSFIKKILETTEAAELSDDVIRTLRWVIGEGSHTKVTGLAACINSVEGEQAAKDVARAERAKRAAKKPPTNRAGKE